MPRHPPCALLSLTYSAHAFQHAIMLRISLGSLGDEYMPCSSTHIHLLLTIISLQLSASLFFLYSVLKVHPAAGMSRSSVTFLPTALSRSYRLASLWLFVTPLRGPSLFPVISLGSRHAAAPAAGGLKWTRTTDLTLIRRAL